MESTNALIPHLFRTEYRKIVSVLVKTFGFNQIEIAEDIASETFLAAAQTWGLEGPPENPVAWLYHVAKNKSKTLLQRDKLFRSKISPDLQSEAAAAFDAAGAFDAAASETEIDLSPQSIADSQLQMMFAICHPSIPRESQIGLSLRILCGFGIEEIADAFLTNKETINKRLFRAREKLREEKIHIGIPAAAEIDSRLETVLTTIYLLFNEGYYSESQNNILRKDLCLEAMRLCNMLVDHPPTDKPQVNALLALMCFHASRFEARTDMHGDLILFGDQDERLWNTELIAQGVQFLHRSTYGDVLSKYHLEASIAFWGTQKHDSFDKWYNILHLYNHLLQVEYSPVAALNRTFAVARVRGSQEAIVEAEKLKLVNNRYYFALLGELYVGIDREKARENFRRALELAKSPADQQTMRRRLEAVELAISRKKK
jgi:RNA polymerase sigma factor (sigma-70 family)